MDRYLSPTPFIANFSYNKQCMNFISPQATDVYTLFIMKHNTELDIILLQAIICILWEFFNSSKHPYTICICRNSVDYK